MQDCSISVARALTAMCIRAQEADILDTLQIRNEKASVDVFKAGVLVVDKGMSDNLSHERGADHVGRSCSKQHIW